MDRASSITPAVRLRPVAWLLAAFRRPASWRLASLRLRPAFRRLAAQRLRPALWLLAASILPAPAFANLRAPRVVPDAPSSALKAASPDLTVSGETLRILCEAQACRVSATYQVSAARPLEAELEFILPVQNDVSVTAGAGPARVDIVPALPLEPDEASMLRRERREWPPMYRATFRTAFQAGGNVLTLEYAQPLGAVESDYGYFKKGRMLQQFRYELWPLREWARADGFEVKLEVAIQRSPPGWWKRWFGTSRSLACEPAGQPATPLNSRLEQKGEQLWLEAVIGPSIPDRIHCYIGDEDLVPRE